MRKHGRVNMFANGVSQHKEELAHMNVRVHFWHLIEDDDHFVDASVHFATITDLPAARRLLRDERGEHADYIEIVDDAHDQHFGFIARVRMQGLPGRFNLRTARHEELNVADDEGVDELAHFLYDHRTRVLVTQRNRLVRSSMIEDILAFASGVNLGLNPVLRQDKWERLGEMEALGSFTFRVHGPLHHPDFSGVMPSLQRLMEQSQRDVNAQIFELKLGAGRGRESSLNPRLVERIMQRIRARDDNVETLKVSGRVRNARNQEVIDFIRDRLVFSAEAEYDGRVLRRDQCRHILRRAIEGNRRYLANLL